MESCSQGVVLQTPVTSEALISLRGRIEHDAHLLGGPSKHRLHKLVNAARKAFAERALLLDENRLLFEQNNESNCRQSTRLTVVNKAKVMSYDDIVEAQAKRDAKEAMVKGKRGPKRKSSAPLQAEAKRTWKSKVKVAEDEIKALGLGNYCSVHNFDDTLITHPGQRLRLPCPTLPPRRRFLIKHIAKSEHLPSKVTSPRCEATTLTTSTISTCSITTSIHSACSRARIVCSSGPRHLAPQSPRISLTEFSILTTPPPPLTTSRLARRSPSRWEAFYAWVSSCTLTRALTNTSRKLDLRDMTPASLRTSLTSPYASKPPRRRPLPSPLLLQLQAIVTAPWPSANSTSQIRSQVTPRCFVPPPQAASQEPSKRKPSANTSPSPALTPLSSTATPSDVAPRRAPRIMDMLRRIYNYSGGGLPTQ